MVGRSQDIGQESMWWVREKVKKESRKEVKRERESEVNMVRLEIRSLVIPCVMIGSFVSNNLSTK